MPIYEYECTACGHHLEALQKFSDAPLMDCPECKQSSLQKNISAAGFQLKGTGWYVTDFRNKDKQASTSSTTKESVTSTTATTTTPTTTSETT